MCLISKYYKNTFFTVVLNAEIISAIKKSAKSNDFHEKKNEKNRKIISFGNFC